MYRHAFSSSGNGTKGALVVSLLWGADVELQVTLEDIFKLHQTL